MSNTQTLAWREESISMAAVTQKNRSYSQRSMIEWGKHLVSWLSHRGWAKKATMMVIQWSTTRTVFGFLEQGRVCSRAWYMIMLKYLFPSQWEESERQRMHQLQADLGYILLKFTGHSKGIARKDIGRIKQSGCQINSCSWDLTTVSFRCVPH